MIEYLEHHIVDHCNLNCAGCSHFSPLAEPWFEDIEDFKRDFTKLANKIDVGMIRLMGGEPLLHPDVGKFLILTRQLFPEAGIQLVTNGVLLKKRKQEIVDICNNANITICISNYGIYNDSTFRDMLDGFKLVRVDGKSYLYHIGLKPDGGEDKQRAFDNCDLHMYRWYYFQNGCFYPCCIGANIQYFNKHFGYNLPTEGRSISIYEHTEEEIKEFLNHPIPLCEFCDTELRSKSYHKFGQSNKEITEWICQ